MRVLSTHIAKELWRHSTAFSCCNVLVFGESFQDGSFVCHLQKMFTKLKLRGLSCITVQDSQLDLFSPVPSQTLSSFDGSVWSHRTVETSGSLDSDFVQSILPSFDFVVGFPSYGDLPMFVNSLQRDGKKFLLIGHISHVFQEGIFRLIQSEKVHWGFSMSGSYVRAVEDFEGELPFWSRHDKLLSGTEVTRLQNLRWYCNTGIKKYHLPFINYHQRFDGDFSKFDNVDALNIPNYHNIPPDYTGVIGTSPLFLDVMRFDEYQLLFNHSQIQEGVRFHNKLCPYRIFIKKRI